LFYGQILTKY
jgi:hypothetical protein